MEIDLIPRIRFHFSILFTLDVLEKMIVQIPVFPVSGMMKDRAVKLPIVGEKEGS